MQSADSMLRRANTLVQRLLGSFQQHMGDGTTQILNSGSGADVSVAYLGGYTSLCRTVLGPKIYVDTRDISLAPHIIMDGEWEMWITKAMFRLLRPGMNCVDLGTNFGWYTLLMADRVGPHGHVIGVDANDRMVELCRKSLAINGFSERCDVHHSAVSDHSGQITFNTLKSYMGAGSVKNLTGAAEQFHDQSVPHTVPCLTLDSLVRGRKIDFMKIDCEGAEPGIIRRADATLKSTSLQIFMEYAPGMYDAGEAVDMIQRLEDAHFEFFSIGADAQFNKLTREQLLNQSGLIELYLRRSK